MYAWDGNRIWVVNKTTKVVKGVPINKPSESAVYLDTSGKTEVWSAPLYDRNGDGRPLKEITETELVELLKGFISYAFNDFYLHKSMGGGVRSRVMAACQRVTSAKINISKDESVTIAEAVGRLLGALPIHREHSGNPVQRSRTPNDDPIVARHQLFGGGRMRQHAGGYVMSGFKTGLPGRHSKRM